MAKTCVPPPIQVFAFSAIQQLLSLPHKSPCFTLLLAWDLESSNPLLKPILANLVEQGLVYLCTWGSNCERVHDLADQCLADCEVEEKQPPHTVMTTWHDDTLEEACFYFRTLAVPTEPKCLMSFDRFAVSIENIDRADEIRRLLSDVDSVD